MSLTRHSLKLLFLYADPNLELGSAFAQDFGLSATEPASDQSAFTGELSEGVTLTVNTYATHDTSLLQVIVGLKRNHLEGPWEKLQRSAEQISRWVFKKSDRPKPWACSRLFFGAASARAAQAGLTDDVAPLLNSSAAAKPEATAYGWLWVVNEGYVTPVEGAALWQRDLLLIIPDDRFAKVQSLWINHFHQGHTRIELYLQKGKHLARQHEAARSDLNWTISHLQEEMLEHLGTADFAQFEPEPVLMEEMSHLLMRFLAQKAAISLLQNSLQSNLTLFDEHLQRAKLDTPFYNLEKTKLQRQIEQIEMDLQNATAIEESASAIQEIQRSAEASRFERSSFLMGYTAALLAGISLFNSFLEIWSLALENTARMLPPAWIRIILSAIASIAIPVAATWAIGRKKHRAWIAGVTSLATVIAMVLFTLF